MGTHVHTPWSAAVSPTCRLRRLAVPPLWSVGRARRRRSHRVRKAPARVGGMRGDGRDGRKRAERVDRNRGAPSVVRRRAGKAVRKREAGRMQIITSTVPRHFKRLVERWDACDEAADDGVAETGG